MNNDIDLRRERNRKIIRAVIDKAETECPGSLALIGVNGSFATGRDHPRSDLDLLIVINDDAGYAVSAAFIQDDMQVGHDLYCVTWDRLRETARCESPQLAKLLDSKIVYSSAKEYEERLEAIRAEALSILRAPFGMEDLERAEKVLREAEHCYAMTRFAETPSDIRLWSAALISEAEDALTLLNKEYYRLGVKFRMEELARLKNRPDDLCALIGRITDAVGTDEIRRASDELMKAVLAVFRKARDAVESSKERPGADDLVGTYEEMFSNWRGKMHLAAETNDRHLALESLLCFRGMLIDEIGSRYEIGDFDVMAAYDPDDLAKTEAAFDKLLAAYRSVCEKSGVKIREYADVDAFIGDYLRKTRRPPNP